MKIGAVVVTFNRLSKLKLSLEKFEEQIHIPSYIIVVDNASTDGTSEYLKKLLLQWREIQAGAADSMQG